MRLILADELKDLRVVTMMSPTELEAIDEWMFENRLRSRGEAIRRLCRIGVLWDGISSELHQQIEASIEDLKTNQGAALEVLPPPSSESPTWVISFVVSCLKGNLATIEHLAKFAEIVRRAGSPADAMKLKGKFPFVHNVSLMLELQVLQEALHKYTERQGDAEGGGAED